MTMKRYVSNFSLKEWIKNRSIWKRNREKKPTDKYVEQSMLLECAIKLHLKTKQRFIYACRSLPVKGSSLTFLFNGVWLLIS